MYRIDVFWGMEEQERARAALLHLTWVEIKSQVLPIIQTLKTLVHIFTVLLSSTLWAATLKPLHINEDVRIWFRILKHSTNPGLGNLWPSRWCWTPESHQPHPAWSTVRCEWSFSSAAGSQPLNQMTTSEQKTIFKVVRCRRGHGPCTFSSCIKERELQQVLSALTTGCAGRWALGCPAPLGLPTGFPSLIYSTCNSWAS